MWKPHITVFTPTYNRQSYLRPLFESLIKQDYRDFEWVVVDDGSGDDSFLELERLYSEQRIAMQYIRQNNSGKHVAINRGVQMARGELFFIVDSDDTVVEGALAAIAAQWEAVQALPNVADFAGVCGMRVYQDGRVIGGEVDYQILDVDAITYRFGLGYKGDRAEVVRTSVMADYPYPHIPGERFCADALMWNRVGRTFKLRFFDVPLIVCEYLPGGITDTSVKLRKQSPRCSNMYYAEMKHLPGLTASQRLKATINFWRFAVYDKRTSFAKKRKMIGSPWSFVLYPVAWIWKILNL